jgi:hypothetical protein
VLERARSNVGHLVKVEIEVDTLAQLREVLETGLADVVLLDNMDTATLTEAVKLAQGRVVLEASGGLTFDTIAAIAATGVDYASSGALTHSAPNFDVAIDIKALALQLQFLGSSESMGDHDSGFDDWWSVGRRYADAVGFFVTRGQATNSSTVYAGSGRDLGGAVSRWTVGQRAAQDGLDESGDGR